jgi:phosphoenolpyruvate-protein kinase (PTS system EI component)
MTERVLRGVPASPGVATGPVVAVDGPQDVVGDPEAALDAAASELADAAARLRAAGHLDEAEIVEANQLMALDPQLRAEVRSLALTHPADEALLAATARHASLLDALGDATLAARADDVRALGRRAVTALGGGGPLRLAEPAIVAAVDVGPAEVAELALDADRLLGLVLARGAVTSHAAIMARALGVPMVVGLGELVTGTAVVDGDDGSVVLDPSSTTRTRADAARVDQRAAKARAAAGRGLPAVTRDGRSVRLLCNAATAAEVKAGLDAGADGVGLLRTELAFLDAMHWPDEDAHANALAPVLPLLAGRVATVRTLDFGGDKTPAFLAGIEERGVALLLAHPDAFAAQLRALLRVAETAQLRVLLPLVEDPAQVRAARRLLREALMGRRAPSLGAMIETRAGTRRATEIAHEADFLSIGTNDLVQSTLGLDRASPSATVAAAAHPEVLAGVRDVVRAAAAAGLTVEVCGEAAGDPHVAGLLVGLGVDELSVAPTRLDSLRATIRALDARRAAAEAEELISAELRDDLREVVDGRGGVIA